MCEWEGPAIKTFWNNFRTVWVSLIVLLFIFFWIGGDFDILLGGAVLYLFFFILTLAMISFSPLISLNMVSDHVFSRWDMDKDFVASRIDRALRYKDINVVIGYEEPIVIFPLPPLSVVVAPGRKRTKVYVGPVTGDNREKVEALKSFVERALGKGG